MSAEFLALTPHISFQCVGVIVIGLGVTLLFDVLSFATLVVAILSILLVLYVENERRQDVAGTVKGLIREEKVRHFGLSEAVVQMVSDGYR